MVTNKSLLVPILLVFIILSGQVPWIIWDFLWVRAAANIIAFFAALLNLRKIPIVHFKKFILLTIPYLYFIYKNNFDIGLFTIPLLFFTLIYINDYQRIKTIKLLTTTTTIILIPSILLWIIYLFRIDLPHATLYATWKDSSLISSQYENYYLFIIKSDAFFRFHSIFDEPGTLGTYLSFLLAINKFKISSQNIFFVIVGLFTLSLAFIIITIVGYILFNINLSLRKISTVSFGLLLFYVIIYNVPSLNKAIIPRLEIQDNKFIGDNRTSETIDEYFNSFISSNQIVTGEDRDTFFSKVDDSFGYASYKIFIIEYGLIGILCLIIIYTLLSPRPLNKQVICFIFIFILSFIQRPYAIQPWQIALFSIITSSYKLIELPKKEKLIISH